MSVKRYRVSYDNGIIEEDGSPRRPADSVPMVKATDFDALASRLEEAERLLREAWLGPCRRNATDIGEKIDAFLEARP